MEILQLVDEIEDVVEKSYSLFGYTITHKEDLLTMIDEIRLKMPDELKQARWVKEERERILAEAKSEADKIVKDTQDKVIALIDEHEITRSAKEKANAILDEARRQEAEMHRNAIAYADSLLERIDKTSSVVLDEIRESRRQLK
ncbi:MAG: ATPase [Clostridia bacterium]|nr:ATPase [Clostridia bacterium]MBR2878660.1 ATPase [Clostridia bacterium]MBR2973145.1 ATPase [Clostridia bacterium]